MNKQIFFRTDIVNEETNRLGKDLLGVKETKDVIDDIIVHKVKINQKHDSRIKRKPGVYYTIDFSNLNIHDHETSEKVIKVFSKVLIRLLESKKVLDKKGTLIGLGNINITPDSIGPHTLDNVIVTRHLFVNQLNSNGYSNISGYSPGVMGNTGIETKDIVEAIHFTVDADYIIVIDALATSDISRINKTIQLTDTGISPGSGVGNKRKEISEDTMHVPVIAIGIPTVVDLNTVTLNILDNLYDHLKEKNVDSKIINLLDELYNENLVDNLKVSKENLNVDMMVTPKDIDEAVEDLSRILAAGLDVALHKKLRDAYL